ncbi:MAG: CsgG/HfaB family protein [Paraprevotella sp.]|nr:CsgG/HfaB family protein [Paraprevotella sp.]
MRRFCIMILVAWICFPALADNTKLRVAVFDPTSSGTSIDEGTKVAIREIISSTIVNAGNYDIVERSLLEKVMQEQSFSHSGAVDDNDATEIGKLAGANKVVLSVVTLTGGRNMLSVKMIDVKTASVERQKVKVVASGELLDVIEPLTLSLVDASANSNEESVVIAASAGTREDADVKPVPQNNEVVFYLPPGYQPKKDKQKDLPLIVKFDREMVGSGTLSTGFTIRIPNPGNGVHKLVIGGQFAIKVDLNKYNFFELQIYRWNYLGAAMYGVSLKEQKMIK